MENLKTPLLKPTVENRRVPAKIPENFARQLKQEDLKKLAEQFGIDTNKPGWEDAYTKKIRELTGT